MKSKRSSAVGVVVGRFQVSELHAGHRHLLNEVYRKHKKVIIAIGSRAGQPTKRDPLDYELRRTMLQKLYPRAVIRPIFDHTSNCAWCKRLDNLIEDTFPNQSAVLYGSRDSFVRAYVGKFPTKFVRSVSAVSGTSLRENIAKVPKGSKLFREGAIYVTANRHPVTYPTVDVAILRDDEVLLGGKMIDGGKLRFIGGFVDPADQSLEKAARREASEEVKNAVIGNFLFMGSSRINDYRYRGSGDGIVTSFFKAQFYDGNPKPGDDIDWLTWVKVSKIRNKLIPSHRPLGEILIREVCMEKQKRDRLIKGAILAGCEDSASSARKK